MSILDPMGMPFHQYNFVRIIQDQLLAIIYLDHCYENTKVLCDPFKFTQRRQSEAVKVISIWTSAKAYKMLLQSSHIINCYSKRVDHLSMFKPVTLTSHSRWYDMPNFEISLLLKARLPHLHSVIKANYTNPISLHTMTSSGFFTKLMPQFSCYLLCCT